MNNQILSFPQLFQLFVLTVVLVFTQTQLVFPQKFSSTVTVYYVATNGNDFNPGTFAAPFATIQKCAEVVTAGQTCSIRGGTYREKVKPANSGLSGAPIRFEPYQNETVTVSGTDPIVRGWKKYSRGNIYYTSVILPVLNYSDTGFLANQIFVNGEMQTEARYPNKNTSELIYGNMTSHFIGCCVTPAQNDPSLLKATVSANNSLPNLPEGWQGANVWMNEWYTSRTGTITGGTPATGLTADMSGPYWREAFWYYLSGKLGLLDTDREWFYNGSFKRLYLWSAVDGAPQNVEVKKRNLAFDLANRSFIEIKNLDIFAATITTDNNSRNVTLDGLRVKYVSHYATLPPLPVSEQAPNSDNGLILASHTHDTGIQLLGENHTLKNSEISFSAGNLVLLKGRNHTIENNVLKDANYMSSHASSIKINGQNHRILRNTISGAGRSIIEATFQLNGTNPIQTEIAYNRISGFGALSNDLGAIYICCSVDLTGTRIHHNMISDPYGFSYFWDVAGIYTDNDSYNATIDHNVVWNMYTNHPKAAKIASKYSNAREKVYNNVFAAPADIGTDARYLVYNNIFAQTAPFAGTTMSNNLFSDSNPGFVNAASGNFTLQNNSPAINAGVALSGFTDGYNDSAPEIGAFEFGQTAWTAGATLTPR